MKNKNFNEYTDEIYDEGYNLDYEEGMVDAIQSVSELYKNACDIVVDVLSDDLTLSEKLLIVRAFEIQSEVLDQLIDDDYEMKCDGDCENCDYHEEELAN